MFDLDLMMTIKQSRLVQDAKYPETLKAVLVHDVAHQLARDIIQNHDKFLTYSHEDGGETLTMEVIVFPGAGKITDVLRAEQEIETEAAKIFSEVINDPDITDLNSAKLLVLKEYIPNLKFSRSSLARSLELLEQHYIKENSS